MVPLRSSDFSPPLAPRSEPNSSWSQQSSSYTSGSKDMDNQGPHHARRNQNLVGSVMASDDVIILSAIAHQAESNCQSKTSSDHCKAQSSESKHTNAERLKRT
ncbi:hypothetical protein BD309DRAFT_878735 [Dichomitus squalens]|nr:uncharacterized protein DICSQDRAFT_138484 [Dichomitus squalens LYAD-421 SS1]EJF59539.1 hypothetical protein DICSQDRAFT_138484 [Dichomitus squalens LYAD-421 SS1]TBU36226.1 hypothetical protein BD309DRAFT_878735 [Dichomitus squalens]TBU58558.1 hypothetical protein BD310DRAFT_819246 [Dichomitus squalens]